jgi:signal transduction histidine kinase
MRLVMSERARVFSIIALASLPLLLLATVNLWQSVGEALDRVSTERTALARAAALTAGQSINADLRSLRIAGQALSAQYSSGSDVEGMELGSLLDGDSNLLQLILFDSTGWNLAAGEVDVPTRTLFVGDRDYFRDAVEQRDAVSRVAVIGRLSQQPTLLLATRLDFTQGPPSVLVGTISMQRLSEDLQAHLAERGVSIVMVDGDGRVILHPDVAAVQSAISLLGRTDVDAAQRGEVGSAVVRGLGGQQILVSYAPVPGTAWSLLIQQPVALALEAAWQDLTTGVALLVFAALIAIAIGVYLGSRLSESYERERAARTSSEQYAAQLELVTSENEQRRRFLERLIVSAPIPIAITQGPDHRVLSVNPRYQMLKPGTDMIGRTMAEIFPELLERGLVERLDQVYQSGHEYTAIDQPRLFASPKASKDERYFTIVYAPYDDARGNTDGVLVIAVETTDAVLARMRVEREKDEFLSTASHELKTPLTALALAAQMVERVLSRPDARSDSERLIRGVRGMLGQIDRANDLINDLLEVSRLQRRPRIRRQQIDLNALVAAAVERTSDALPEDSGYEVKLHLLQPSLFIAGDESRLDQVLTNLLSNAVKYSPEGGDVDITVSRTDGWAELRVVDHGMGIPDDEQQLLFLPFSRTNAARESPIEGTGLGLYITRQIVDAHNGFIRYEPTPGGGATFIVRLPLAKTDSEKGESRPSESIE